MKSIAARIWLCASCMPALLCTARAAEVDARPPNRLIFSANGVRLVDVDDGGGGSLNYLHYLKPDALVGLGVEHQFIAESEWTFGSLRGAYGFGAPETKTTVYAELHAGRGDEDGRDFDYGVGVLGVSQSLSGKFSLQLETRQIEVDRSSGNLPKLGVTYVWSPRWATNVAYAKSVSGNLGTELTSGRVDYYGRALNVFLGGAAGSADPVVLNLQPGIELPVSNLKQGFAGVGKTFSAGEVQLVGDYLESGDSERITVLLNFTAYFRRPR
jgi:hypothetical protein